MGIYRGMKTFISAFLLCFLMAFGAYGAQEESDFPFLIEFDTGVCERLCYAGHSSSGVKYKEGYAIAPYTSFRIETIGTSKYGLSMDRLSVEISLIYENDDNTMSLRETVKVYDKGDIEDDQSWYPVFDETNVENLLDRDRLYSDSLSAIELSLSYDGLKDAKSEKDMLLQVCRDGEFGDMLTY